MVSSVVWEPHAGNLRMTAAYQAQPLISCVTDEKAFPLCASVFSGGLAKIMEITVSTVNM